MRDKIFIFLWFISLFSFDCLAQNREWLPFPNKENQVNNFVRTQSESILFVMDSVTATNDGDNLISQIKGDINKNLNILHVNDFNERVILMFATDRDMMYNYRGLTKTSDMQIGGDMLPSFILSVYDKEYSPVNIELMRLMIIKEWGEQYSDEHEWIKNGLACYATPQAYNCDGQNLETRYAYLMQKNKLLNILKFPKENIVPQYKIACIQAGYTIQYIIENYGIDKLKQLWQSDIKNFDRLFDISFKELSLKINDELSIIHSKPIEYNYNYFITDCIGIPHDGWLKAYNPIQSFNPNMERMVTKELGNLKFTIDSTFSIYHRNTIVEQTQKYINDCLGIIHEPLFTDSIHLTLVPTKKDIKNFLGVEVNGVAMYINPEYPHEHIIYSVYGGERSPLKHELMHMITYIKWGDSFGMGLDWLHEGLATFSDPETENCDNHTFEERYVYFLQKDKLLNLDSLMILPSTTHKIKRKIAYNQSAYLVNNLIQEYGIEKLKALWQSKGMEDFEYIFGTTLEQQISKINEKLKKEYPNPIDFNWEIFEKGCIE